MPYPWQWYMSPNLYDIYHCHVYSEKLLMMDRGTVQNMYGMVSIIIYYIIILKTVTHGNGICQQTCMTYTIAVCSEKLLMMDRGTVRNM